MLRSPVLGQRLFDLFHYLRWETSVPHKLNEFAILIIGRQWRSQVEWFAHAPLAQKAGLSSEIIAELKANKRPSGMAEDEAVVYDFVTELTTTRKVSDETYAQAKRVFSDQQIVDLTAVAGNYIMVAMLLAMAEDDSAAGQGAAVQGRREVGATSSHVMTGQTSRSAIVESGSPAIHVLLQDEPRTIMPAAMTGSSNPRAPPDPAEMGEGKSRKIFQAVAERAVEADMRQPDHRDRQHQRR